MKYVTLLSLCLLLLAFVPRNHTDILPTKMEVTVRNDLGNVEEDASVQLYKTQEDYDKEQNPVTEVKKTDAKGRVVFSDLEPIEYYVRAEKGDMDNSGAGVKTIPMVAKRVNKVTIIISE